MSFPAESPQEPSMLQRTVKLSLGIHKLGCSNNLGQKQNKNKIQGEWEEDKDSYNLNATHLFVFVLDFVWSFTNSELGTRCTNEVGWETMQIPELLTQRSTNSGSPEVGNRNLWFIMLPGGFLCTVGKVPMFERLCGKGYLNLFQ